MLLEKTITQLNIGYTTPERALELGQLGYLQWLGALRCDTGYFEEATRAYGLARPFIETSPAIEVFCSLLIKSIAAPLETPDLKLPSQKRRGGAKARRDAF